MLFRSEWNIAGTATFGATDNPNGTPEPQIEGDPEPEPDGFFTISPSFQLQLETKDATQTFDYAVGYTLYFVNTQLSTFNQTLAYGLRAPASETVEVSFALTGAQTTMSEFAILSAAPGGQAQASEGGDNVIWSAGAGLAYSAQLGRTWSFSQAIAGAYAHTVVPDSDDTQTTTASLATNLSTFWQYDQLGIGQSNDTQYSPAQQLGGVDMDDSFQFLHQIGRASCRERV